MSIEDWLKNLHLSEYIDVFKEESIELDIVLELTSDDLKEIGVKKLGHRKIILKAISELHEKSSTQLSDNNKEKNELIKLCELLPKVISSPLNEYISDEL